jgi:hypothetical protein
VLYLAVASCFADSIETPAFRLGGFTSFSL